jgi:hypothetical protein
VGGSKDLFSKVFSIATSNGWNPLVRAFCFYLLSKGSSLLMAVHQLADIRSKMQMPLPSFSKCVCRNKVRNKMFQCSSNVLFLITLVEDCLL